MNRSLILLVTLLAVRRSLAQPNPAALTAFNTYINTYESHLTTQPEPSPTHQTITLQTLTPAEGQPLPGALLHHWRATIFAPNLTAAQLQHLLRDFTHYPQIFAPQVLSAAAVPQPNGHLLATLRVRQKHVLTVVLDSTYDVASTPTSSTSRSTRIYEIASPNTPSEHPLSPTEEHGFLWRQNTYWTWQQCPTGLFIQLDSISLTRSIPTGLGWAIRPFLQSVPRDSLQFTLNSALAALRP